MPAPHTRRAEGAHTDRQTSAMTPRRVCGPPGFSRLRQQAYLTEWRPLLTGLGSGSELPSRRAGSLRSCAAGTSIPFRSAESFLPRRRLPASQRGLGFTLRFWSGLSTGATSILPLCPGSVLFSRSGDPGRAPKCYARCPNPRAGRERLPRQCNWQKKGSLLLTRVRAPAARPAQHLGSESAGPRLSPSL